MGWRDELKVHLACEMLPAMTPDALQALSDDIRTNGLQDRAKLIPDGNGYEVIDGRSRLDALEMIRPIKVFDGTVPNRRFFEVIELEGRDPFILVTSLNVHRRHLTPLQKRELIAKVLKQRPELSDRAIGDMTKADHKTVAPIRSDLERGGEIPHHRSRVGKDGVKQPSTRPARKSTSPAPGTSRKMRSPQVEISNEEFQPSLPFELPHAPSLVPKPPPPPKAKAAMRSDPVATQRASIRGAVIGVGKIAGVDFDQVATLMPIDQLLAARSELDQAAQIIADWRDALDAALDRAASAEAAPEPSAQAKTPASPEHYGVR